MANESEIVEKFTGKLPPLESMNDAVKAVDKLLAESGMGEKERVALVKRVVSFGPAQEFLEDPAVEDIMINALNPIFVYREGVGMVRTEKRFASYEELDLFVRKLLLFSGKEKLGKINDLRLPGGARANIINSPFGQQVTIRRFKLMPPSIIDLVEWGTLDYELAAKLWMYSEGLGVKPANMLIAGPPAAGKTTLLNALFAFFPATQRTVIIEDTLELNTKEMENCSRLVSDDDITMEDLVKNSLRMRPDRLIVGEVRGAEAKDLMTAMNIGKICMGTIHAGNAREAVMRLENEPMNVPPAMIPLIDVIVMIGRFGGVGAQIRKITGVCETAGLESGKVLLSDLYTYDFQRKTLVEMVASVTYRDRLAEAAGVSPKDILDEIERRAGVLRVLAKKGVTSIGDISRFCRRYCEDPETALKKLK